MFADPSHTIEQFELQSGARVADFGAGSGALAFVAARAVGEAGKVYAIEVQKELLERLKGEARAERLHNIEALWGDIERPNGTHLKAATVDAVIVSNVLFQAEDKPGLIAEAKRILKLGGRLLLVDWSESFGGLPAPRPARQAGMGPQPEAVVPEKAARELFEKGGFSVIKNINAGAHHYGMVFRKT